MIEEINKCTTTFAKEYTNHWLKANIRWTDINGTSNKISSMLTEKFPQYQPLWFLYINHLAPIFGNNWWLANSWNLWLSVYRASLLGTNQVALGASPKVESSARASSGTLWHNLKTLCKRILLIHNGGLTIQLLGQLNRAGRGTSWQSVWRKEVRRGRVLFLAPAAESCWLMEALTGFWLFSLARQTSRHSTTWVLKQRLPFTTWRVSIWISGAWRRRLLNTLPPMISRYLSAWHCLPQGLPNLLHSCYSNRQLFSLPS